MFLSPVRGGQMSLTQAVHRKVLRRLEGVCNRVQPQPIGRQTMLERRRSRRALSRSLSSCSANHGWTEKIDQANLIRVLSSVLPSE